jgi:tetratricopeptide (TPR) repeat protein
MKRFFTILLVVILSTYSFAQDFSKLVSAFSESYEKEKTGKYAEAASALKAMYDENSYEINLRLGWLTYNQGQFTEALAYYNKAITIMPMAIEPILGVVLPA